jgi:transmembrane 9 superfamily protein 2/4
MKGSPENLELLASLFGTGMQLNITLVIMVMMNIFFKLYKHRSSMVTTSIFVYSISSIFGGYSTANIVHQYQGKKLKLSVFLTSSIWPGFVCGIGFLVNFISIFYKSSRAISFSSMVNMLLSIGFSIDYMGTSYFTSYLPRIYIGFKKSIFPLQS